VRARLVLELEYGESIHDLEAIGPVIVAEVTQVTSQTMDSPNGDTTTEYELDVTYVESMTRAGADRRLGREPVGWPLIVYARSEGTVETASPGG
jgi:hypothetical protein